MLDDTLYQADDIRLPKTGKYIDSYSESRNQLINTLRPYTNSDDFIYIKKPTPKMKPFDLSSTKSISSTTPKGSPKLNLVSKTQSTNVASQLNQASTVNVGASVLKTDILSKVKVNVGALAGLTPPKTETKTKPQIVFTDKFNIFNNKTKSETGTYVSQIQSNKIRLLNPETKVTSKVFQLFNKKQSTKIDSSLERIGVGDYKINTIKITNENNIDPFTDDGKIPPPPPPKIDPSISIPALKIGGLKMNRKSKAQSLFKYGEYTNKVATTKQVSNFLFGKNKRASVGATMIVLFWSFIATLIWVILGTAIEKLIDAGREILTSENAIWFLDFFSTLWFKILPALIVLGFIIYVIYSNLRKEPYYEN